MKLARYNFIATLAFAAATLMFGLRSADAQVYIQTVHEVSAQVAAKKGDFVKARKRAVAEAMKTAVTNAVIDLMGEADFKANRRYLREILGNPQRYVQKYRFLEAYDDPVEGVSVVKLEVSLFSAAITKSLGNLGVIAAPAGQKSVVILINETSPTTGGQTPFWDAVPISETALSQEFVGAGIHVVGRDPIRNIVPEDVVLKAIKGDLDAAVNIGLKAGADIVILGNASSSLVERDLSEGEKTIHATINVKVVSSFKSVLVAAKSDSATAKDKEFLSGELAAFGAASKKLSEFLLTSIRRHWEAGAEVKKKAPPQKDVPSLPMTDL